MPFVEGIGIVTADLAELLADFKAIAVFRYRSGLTDSELFAVAKCVTLAATALNPVRDYVDRYRPVAPVHRPSEGTLE
jgi:hypothetical protein